MCLMLYVGSSARIEARDMAAGGRTVALKPTTDKVLLEMVGRSHCTEVEVDESCCCDFLPDEPFYSEEDETTAPDDILREAQEERHKRAPLRHLLMRLLEDQPIGALTLVEAWSGDERRPVRDNPPVALSELDDFRMDGGTDRPDRYVVIRKVGD
jgi:hypothetical protein